MEPKRRTRGFRHEAGQETGGGGGQKGGVSVWGKWEMCEGGLSF